MYNHSTMKSIEGNQPTVDVELEQQSAPLQDSIIMMVDDEPLMLEILELYLSDEGYKNFVPVQQSTQAMDILRSETPDVLFLDINMPEVDGFDILQAIRADEKTQHLAVIVLTSATDSATKLIALELGATDFLEKPIDSSELALRLRNTLTAKAYQDRLAYYDGLTGLPNRTLFLDRINWSVAHAQRTGTGLSVMNVTMDRFQNVNDSLGPQAGDNILKQAAERLQRVVKDVSQANSEEQEGLSAIVSRIGGDEFSILLPGLVDDNEIMAISDQILATMKDVFLFEGNEIYSTASIGIARFPADSSETELLLKHAGAANELAKQRGRNNSQFFSSEITERADARRNLEADLHGALEREELQLYYQPQIDVTSGAVLGMESLLRWIHPERGMVSPDEFIPLAEDNGSIIAIGEWVLHEACRQTRAWQREGLDQLSVSVNVSSIQFRDPGLPEAVRDACGNCGLDPKWLILEITEGLVMEDIDSTAKMLHEMKEIGVAISVDDFGTGYSALAYLKRFPIDELKIDRSFVSEIPGNEDDSAIVRAVIAMSHSLELSVVAEGVETASQASYLHGLKCDVIQGHFFSKPLPQQEFRVFALKNKLRKST
jgi:diguanylate cyclase (GGDEF)-like protein